MKSLRYSAIVPSRDMSNILKCIEHLSENSNFCDEIIVLWNGNETEIDFQISNVKIVSLKDDVYKLYNHGVHCCKNDLFLLINDDMYFPKDWDLQLMEVENSGIDLEKSVITTMLVESGYVAVNPKNIQCDFGQDWGEFDKEGFDEYSRQYHESHDAFESNFGWYMPVFMGKIMFNKHGGYPTTEPFPAPNDIKFFQDVFEDKAILPIQLHSLVYHFQRLSQRQQIKSSYLRTNGQTKLNLCCGNDEREGYLNLDKHDIDISSGKIPFESESFTEILFFHALEHFRFEVGHSLLKEMYRILKPNGVLEVAVPDLLMAINDYARGIERVGCAEPIYRIYGQNSSDELVHKSGYTAEFLHKRLEEVGFQVTPMYPRYEDELYFKATK